MRIRLGPPRAPSGTGKGRLIYVNIMRALNYFCRVFFGVENEQIAQSDDDGIARERSHIIMLEPTLRV